MVEIISIRFQNGGKEYYFNPNGLQFQVGDGVIVETTRGTEYAQCVRGNNLIDEIELTAPLRPVVRRATPEDQKQVERNKEREKHALAVCQQKIAEHGLDMKLVSAEYGFDGSKILFFFTSEGRVDFRALVKDLAGTLHARIELRQIGVRDEAKLLGGLGICGKPFCCSQFLEEFQPVSIKMAKTQNLSLNPTKISGTCGRLMCCLKYEQEAYEDLVKRAPKQDSFVETPDGAGTVSGSNLLRQTAQVRLESARGLCGAPPGGAGQAPPPGRQRLPPGDGGGQPGRRHRGRLPQPGEPPHSGGAPRWAPEPPPLRRAAPGAPAAGAAPPGAGPVPPPGGQAGESEQQPPPPPSQRRRRQGPGIKERGPGRGDTSGSCH